MYKDEALKALYRSDSVMKHFIAEFRRAGEGTPFLTIHEGERFYDMTMEESLSSEENLNFGSCEAAQIKLTMIDLDDAVKNTEMTLYQVLDGLFPAADLYPGNDLYPSGYIMPFGKYVIQSADRQPNTRYRIITALDLMCKFDVNVIDWYNSLPFPLTLREFRARLCQHIGVVEHVPDYLPNDNILIEKTIDTAQLMGRDVLIACEQANGVFGHFDRSGVLQHVTLQPNYTLMPAPDLYPSDDLYPMLPGTMNEQVYDEQIDPYLMISCQFEEYTVKSIDKVQIRQEEGDIGAIYGTGTNCLTVEGNFLLFGKSADELNKIAEGIFGMVSSRQYIPYKCNLKGLPYMEVGDTELLEFGNGNIATYIIKRTLKGIYALKDTYSATGEEIRSTEHNINTEIIQLKGKAAILKKNVDEVSAELIDFEKETSAKFAITAEQISAEVKRAQEAEASLKIMADQISMSVKNLKENTESQFLQTANQIALKVSKGDVSSQLSIEPDDITIRSNRFSWEATNSSMLKDGTLHCVNGIFSGNLESDNFMANGSGVYLGDFEVSVDNSNIFRAVDGSVSIQTAAGGPFGRYATLVLDTASGTTTLSDHHLETATVTARGEMYIKNSWWGTYSVTQTCEELWNAVFNGSDERLKQNIKPLPRPVAKWIIENTNVKQWLWRENKTHDMGMVAQELAKTLKDYGIDYKFVGLDAKNGNYYIDYKKYIPVLIMAIQDIYDKLEKTLESNT